MEHKEYYTVTLVTLSSIIPVIYGIVFSIVYSDERNKLNHLFGISFKGRQISAGVLRMVYLFILSFITLLLVINLTSPVPQEGWLRTLMIIILLSAESAFTYSLIKLSCSRFSCIMLLVFLVLILAAMPIGLFLHRPWNSIVFVSPFYWLVWSWLIPSAGESLSYAAIGVALSAVYLLAAGSLLRKKE
ncbi:MAG: hypothetical protein IPN68_06470 [Bacteroidetes bacterium]|nr:hypothetical protein [Bacteroidota bacterium]